MLDVWFLGQINYCTIEHPWIINEIVCARAANFEPGFFDKDKHGSIFAFLLNSFLDSYSILSAKVDDH